MKRVKDRLLRRLYAGLSVALSRSGRYITRPLATIGRTRLFTINSTDLYSDYIRHSQLELCAYEIQQNAVPGSIAELGVYRGDFARILSEAFPNRKLFLFDTFTGFDQQQLHRERTNQSPDVGLDFTATSADLVLGKMSQPERCEIRQGIFPESAKDVTDEFAFVSIDADLFEPIYDGLTFFYPKLVPGGYIFVHDFNNSDWPGAALAVRRYCSEHNVVFVPLSDVHGTAIIAKPSSLAKSPQLQ